MRQKAKKEVFREDARSKKEIQEIQKASVEQARKLIEVAAVKASGISNSTQVKIKAAEVSQFLLADQSLPADSIEHISNTSQPLRVGS